MCCMKKKIHFLKTNNVVWFFVFEQRFPPNIWRKRPNFSNFLSIVTVVIHLLLTFLYHQMLHTFASFKSGASKNFYN